MGNEQNTRPSTIPGRIYAVLVKERLLGLPLVMRMVRCDLVVARFVGNASFKQNQDGEVVAVTGSRQASEDNLIELQRLPRSPLITHPAVCAGSAQCTPPHEAFSLILLGSEFASAYHSEEFPHENI